MPVTKEGCVAAVPFVARSSCLFRFTTRLFMGVWPGGGGQYAASRYPVPSTGAVHGGSSNVLMLIFSCGHINSWFCCSSSFSLVLYFRYNLGVNLWVRWGGAGYFVFGCLYATGACMIRQLVWVGCRVCGPDCSACCLC